MKKLNILLTNDDGIFAPGLRALRKELRRLGNVTVIAPALEQSGVGHSITFLQPLVAKQVYDGDRLRGWAVEGSPADSVKLGIFEFCPRLPDLVVSGINGGLNAGIDVFIDMVFNYPTLADSYKYAAYECLKALESRAVSAN